MDNVRYGPGGHDTGKPFNNVTERWDDNTRQYTDYRSGAAVSRAYNSSENTEADARIASATKEANATTIRNRVEAAINANNAYRALGAPTAAQTTAQVKLLSQECTGIFRLLLNKLDATD